MLAHTSGFENWSENIVGCDANGSQEPFSMQRERERNTHLQNNHTSIYECIRWHEKRDATGEDNLKKNKKKQAVMSVQNQPGPWQS